MKTQGIRNVDFYITATGEGIVNHNGSAEVYDNIAGIVRRNHQMPKLKGFDMYQRVITSDNDDGKTKTVSLSDISTAKPSLSVSSACIREQIFKDISSGVSHVTHDITKQALSSLHGILRGYTITEKGNGGLGRKSPLRIMDFVCEKPGLVFNKGVNSRVIAGTNEEKTALFSNYKTDRNLHYTSKGSIEIETLQFIPLENSLGKSAYSYQIKAREGHEIAQSMTQFLQDLDVDGLNPQVHFVKSCVRKGGFTKVSQAGVLLNDDAIHAVCIEAITLIKDLVFFQGSGYLKVTDVRVDYNDGKPFRSEHDPSAAVSIKSEKFHEFYYEETLDDSEFDKLQTLKTDQRAEHKNAKEEVKEKARRTKESSNRTKDESDLVTENR